MSNHTPGPWFVNRYRATIQTASPAEPSSSTNTVICYTMVGNAMMPQTSDADARLIAAAPGLLAALQLAFDGLDEVWMDCHSAHVSKIKASIAEAEDTA